MSMPVEKNWNLLAEYKAKEISKCMEDECSSNDRVLRRDKNVEFRDCRQLVYLYLDLVRFLGKSAEVPEVNVISKKAPSGRNTSWPSRVYILGDQQRMLGVKRVAAPSPGLWGTGFCREKRLAMEGSTLVLGAWELCSFAADGKPYPGAKLPVCENVGLKSKCAKPIPFVHLLPPPLFPSSAEYDFGDR